MKNRPGWISTFSKRPFFFDNINENAITINDIAHALSNICRFAGHCPHHYSVAQHSVLVSRLCSHKQALAGLLHDATEAYIGDMVSPLKRMMPEFVNYEDRLYKIIAKKYCIADHITEEVTRADISALALEAELIMGVNPEDWALERCVGISPHFVRKMTPMEAEQAFLEEFKFLTAQNGNSENAQIFMHAFKPPRMDRDPLHEERFIKIPRAVLIEANHETGEKIYETPKGKPENILEEANRLVSGDRGAAYGHPMEDFTRTAKIWSAILGVEVPVEKVALMMAGVKISRACHAPKRDNWTDMAGYALTGFMVEQKQGKM